MVSESQNPNDSIIWMCVSLGIVAAIVAMWLNIPHPSATVESEHRSASSARLHTAQPASQGTDSHTVPFAQVFRPKKYDAKDMPLTQFNRKNLPLHFQIPAANSKAAR